MGKFGLSWCRPGLVVVAGGGLLLLVWLFRPSAPVDLRAVNASALAQREAAAWRAYYEERYPALFWQVFQVAYTEYGFSLGDSLRLSVEAARAGRSFRHSNDPTEVARALAGMENYYGIIRAGSVQEFDSKELARWELRWWQMRREKLPPEEWAQTMARQCELIYGVPAVAFLPAVRLRVEAMVLRDARGLTGMTETDWLRIRELLLKSATLFGKACRGEDPAEPTRDLLSG